MTTKRILLSAALVLLVIAPLRAETVEALVDTIHGKVEFAPPGTSSFVPLKKGQSLPVGTTIRTGGESSADIITTPGSAIHVGANSLLRLTALAFSKSGSTVTERKAHVKLESGVISALIDPSTPKATDFQVQTPDGSAAARGTFYAVMVSHGKTYVTDNRGKVDAIADPKNRLRRGYQ